MLFYLQNFKEQFDGKIDDVMVYSSKLIVDLVFKNSILRSEPMGIAENVS